MYHVSAQGIDEHMINVHYYYTSLLVFHLVMPTPRDRSTLLSWFKQKTWNRMTNNNLLMHPPYTTAFSQQVRLCWKPGYPWTARSPQTLWFPHPGSLFPPETERSLYNFIHLTMRCEQAELWCGPTGRTMTGERFKCLENWALQATTDSVQLTTDGLR